MPWFVVVGLFFVYGYKQFFLAVFGVLVFVGLFLCVGCCFFCLCVVLSIVSGVFLFGFRGV